MQNICTALTQEGSPETTFKVVLTEQPNSLQVALLILAEPLSTLISDRVAIIKALPMQVVCQWKEEGQTMFFKHPPLVLARDEEDSSETQIFDALLSKCEALQVGYRANDDNGAINMIPCIIAHPCTASEVPSCRRGARKVMSAAQRLNRRPSSPTSKCSNLLKHKQIARNKCTSR